MKSMFLSLLGKPSSKTKSEKTMSGNNRLITGIVGGALLAWGLSAKKGGRLRTLAGSSLIASSIMGTEDNILSMVKSVLPGPGVKPSETDQPSPRRRMVVGHNLSLDTLREMLAVG